MIYALCSSSPQRTLHGNSSNNVANLNDTYETMNEFGPMELISRDLEMTPYGALRKSLSTDSLSSISSIGNNFGQDFTVGQIEVTMDYHAHSNTLHVTLIQGKDLMERKEDGNFESCFVHISLLPDEQIVGISRVSVHEDLPCNLFFQLLYWMGKARPHIRVCRPFCSPLPYLMGVRWECQARKSIKCQLRKTVCGKFRYRQS